jgi:CIC family chloride channel protein
LAKWIPLSILIGILGGLGAVLFHGLTIGLDSFFPKQGVIIILSLFIGGLVSGFFVYTFAPETAGHGTDAAIATIHAHCGKTRKRTWIIKLIASAFTIGSGGSAGEEGPSIQIGGGLSSILGTSLKLHKEDLRILGICGMGAALAGIFKSPIGGAIFAAEVLYKEDMEYQAVIPAVISGIIGGSIFMIVFGTDPILHAPEYHIREALTGNYFDLFIFLLIGLVVSIVGRVFIHTFYGLERGFRELNIPRIFKPAIGAVVFGILVAAFSLGGTLGPGYETLQEAIDGNASNFFALLVGKIVGTSLTVASGGSGGVVAPTLFIGGMVGGLIGDAALLVPHVTHNLSIFILVGMSAALAGITKTPLAGIILVFEFTGINTPVPLAVGSLVAYLSSGPSTINLNQKVRRDYKPCMEEEIV